MSKARSKKAEARGAGDEARERGSAGPVNWTPVPIGTVCESTAVEDPHSRPSFRYVDISSIDRISKTIAETLEVKGSEAPSRARKVVRAGDVLVSTVRPNLNAVAIVPGDLDREIASTGFSVLRPRDSHLSGRYLFYYCCTTGFVEALSAKVRGAQYPAVSDADVRQVEVPLPRLSEQRRIVEILDQADRLRQLRTEADAKADRILPALFNKTFGDPATNPKGWPTDRFGSALVEKPRNGLSPSFAGTVSGRVLMLNAITGRSFNEQAAKDAHFAAPPKPNDLVSDQDFLICRGNGNLKLVGQARFPRRSLPDTVFPDTMIAARVDAGRLDRAYLQCLWDSPFFRIQIESRARTTSGIHKINQQTIEALEIRFPPIEMQRRFGQQAKIFWETPRHESASALALLFNNLLSQAFCGSLTASWREGHMKELLEETEQQAKALAEVR